eukprot:6492499-Amphidinium_carterae.3
MAPLFIQRRHKAEQYRIQFNLSQPRPARIGLTCHTQQSAENSKPKTLPLRPIRPGAADV